MSALVSQFVEHIVAIFKSGDGANLVASVPLTQAHPFYGPLNQALRTVPEAQISTSSFAGQCASLPLNVRDIFASFAVACLKNARGQRSSTAEQAAYAQFTTLQAVYVETNRLYAITSPDGLLLHGFLNPLIVNLAQELLIAGNRAARLSTAPTRDARSARSIRDTTRQTIERSIQVATANVSAPDWEAASGGSRYMVGDNIWPLANILWRIYAERRLHQQSLDLARSIENVQPREDRRIQTRGYTLRQVDVCQSYYWRGRAYLILMDFRTSKRWLDKAWSLSPESAWQQRRAILIRLIPVNLLLGIIPRQDTLERYNLSSFVPLLHAYRTGNVAAWRRELDVNREWYRSRHIWLLLYERGETLVWRNLYRQSLKAYYSLHPDAPRGRCPTWVFTEALRSAFVGSGQIEDGNTTLEDIISSLSSLIDHSLILGFLSYSSTQFVMKSSPDGFGGFPRLSQVVPRAILANA